jgi:hypothetical protein
MLCHLLLSFKHGLKIIILFFLCFFASVLSFSQTSKVTGTGFFRGFIIINSGDSLTGYINVPDFMARTNWVQFKTDINSPVQAFNPYELSSFGSMNGQIRFKSIEVPVFEKTELSFVRVIVDGLYDIYSYKFLKYEHILLQGTDRKVYDVTNPPEIGKVSQGTTTISREAFNSSLSLVFMGNPDLLLAINSLEPSRKSIIKNVTKYYDQKGMPYMVYDINQTDYSFGLIANMAAEILFIDTEGLNIKSFPALVPYAGISVSAINRMSGLGGIFETTLGYRALHYNIKEEFASTVLYYEVFQKAIISSSRLGLSVNPGSGKKYRPLIEAGASFSALLSSDYDNYLDIHDLTENVVYSTNDNNCVNSDTYYGGFIRAGISFKSSRNNFFKITAGFERLWDHDSEKISSVNVGFSYMFNLK